MTKAQVAIIALVVSLWIINTGIIFGLYFYLKKTKNKLGISLLNAEVPESGIRKVGKSEMFLHFSLLIIFLYYVLFLSGHNPNSTLIRAHIVAHPCVALFNAKKRTGKSFLVLIGTFALYLNLILSCAFVDFPVKAPILEIAQSKVILNKTTVSELMK